LLGGNYEQTFDIIFLVFEFPYGLFLNNSSPDSGAQLIGFLVGL
jgi:hypothetical protein